MAVRKRVTCINKSNRTNPYERIISIGGSDWKYSQPEVIRYIKSGDIEFYVNVNGSEVKLIVATHSGNEYVKTERDGEHPNNLLSLSECP
jgi:hypothetical protein